MNAARHAEPQEDTPWSNASRAVSCGGKIARGDDFVPIDTLPADAYRKGHLPGAISIPSDDILTEAPKHLPEGDQGIVVYCGSGPCKRSEKAARRLVRLGYTNLRDYPKGRADGVAAELALDGEPPIQA